jgi:thioredoxin family protein
MYPHERSLVEKHKDAPFVIIGVNSDQDREKLKPALEKEKITWRSFWNGDKGTSGPISKAWNIKGWPTLYVIDAQGIIRYKAVGANEEEIDAAIEKALADAAAKKK